MNNFCRQPEWMRNLQMMPGFSTVKDLDDSFMTMAFEKTEDPKSNKGNLTSSPHKVNVIEL